MTPSLLLSQTPRTIVMNYDEDEIVAEEEEVEDEIVCTFKAP